MMKDYKRGVYTDFALDEAVEFHYCTKLNTSEKIKFINNVMEFIVGTYYYPMLRDIIFDYAIIQYFTDIRFDEDLNVDQIEQLLNTTNIVDIVKMDMEDGLYDELRRAIDMNIEYKTGVHMNRIEAAVESLLDAVKDKVANVDPTKVMNLAEQLSHVNDRLTADDMIQAYVKNVLPTRMEEAAEEKKRKKADGGLRVIE